MRGILLLPAALALAACGGATAGEASGEESVAETTDLELRDGFTLPAEFGPVTESELAIPGAPNISWSYTLPSDVDGDKVEAALLAQLEANGYALSSDTDTGFAAAGPDGHEMALMVIEFSGQQSVSLNFTEPSG